MRRIFVGLIWILILTWVISACSGLGSEGTAPTDLPNTETPFLEVSPSAAPVFPTSSHTPAPSPSPPPTFTPTPEPFISGNLELLTYRTLGQVEILASIPLQDVIDLEFSPDGQVLRARVRLDEAQHQDTFYDLESGEEIFRIEGGQRIYYGQESHSILALEGNEIIAYDLLSGNQESVYTGEHIVSALSPDGLLVIELEYEERDGPGTTFHVIDLPSGEERYQLYVNGRIEKEGFIFDQDGENMAVIYHVPPGTYVTSVWVAGTGKVLYTEYGFTEIVLHPFGSEVAVSSGRRSYISLISTCTWEQRVYLGSAGEEPGFYAMNYAEKGRLMYALSDRDTTNAFFWYPPSGERIELDLGGDLLAVSISPDRRLMASSNQSGLIKIWGVR